MPVFKRDGAEIYYEVHGSGYPLLIFAPGGLRSQLSFWRESPSNPNAKPVWMDPMVDLAGKYRVVAMDQRNAGRSTARFSGSDGWHSFTGDHLALMDHLGIRRAHIMGGCIGVSFCLKMCEMAPERVAAAVLQNPIGDADNRQVFVNLVETWAKDMRARPAGLDEAALKTFANSMFGGDFVFSVSRDFVRGCKIPMLVMPGDDAPHPKVIGEEIASLAPNAEIMREWKGPAHLAEAIKRVEAFLDRHTPR